MIKRVSVLVRSRVWFGGLVRWRRFRVWMAWIASMDRKRPLISGPRWERGPPQCTGIKLRRVVVEGIGE